MSQRHIWKNTVYSLVLLLSAALQKSFFDPNFCQKFVNARRSLVCVRTGSSPLGAPIPNHIPLSYFTHFMTIPSVYISIYEVKIHSNTGRYLCTYVLSSMLYANANANANANASANANANDSKEGETPSLPTYATLCQLVGMYPTLYPVLCNYFFPRPVRVFQDLRFFALCLMPMPMPR